MLIQVDPSELTDLFAAFDKVQKQKASKNLIWRQSKKFASHIMDVNSFICQGEDDVID